MKIDSKKIELLKKIQTKVKREMKNLRNQTKNINITLTTRVQTGKRGFEIWKTM